MKRLVIDYMAKDETGAIISPIFNTKSAYLEWVKNHRITGDRNKILLENGRVLSFWRNYQSSFAPLRINL